MLAAAGTILAELYAHIVVFAAGGTEAKFPAGTSFCGSTGGAGGEGGRKPQMSRAADKEGATSNTQVSQ